MISGRRLRIISGRMGVRLGFDGMLRMDVTLTDLEMLFGQVCCLSRYSLNTEQSRPSLHCSTNRESVDQTHRHLAPSAH